MKVSYKYRFEDKGAAYRTRLASALDSAVEHMIIDVERLSKTMVPLDTGRLQSSGKPRRVSAGHWEFSYHTPYARWWHYNQTHPRSGTPVSFKHGRKTHYLERPGRIVGQRHANYVKNAVGSL